MVESINYFSSESIEKIFHRLKTSKTGLSEKEAGIRLKKNGPNAISKKKELSVVLEFLSHFKSPFIIILLVAATISAYLGEMKNFVIITVMVLASVILDFFEEHSASNAAKKLSEKVSITATVIRHGKKREIKAANICVGDIIFLSSGDLVPADARVIESNDFFVNQSALTGESFPREKFSNVDENGQDDNANESNLVFLGTSVVSGTACAVVFQIGKETAFGRIAESLSQKEEKSEFEFGIVKFGFFIMKVILFLVLFIFLGNAFVNHNFLQSFIFAIAIAVGVTPELLPVIMSVTMARGSQKMARAGVIVKKLSSIPNFGGMDILCTDKTGTLTDGEIKLVNYTDIFGAQNEDVFLYTYLNSFYQTGIKNQLDKTVMDYKKTDVSGFKKIEEIPFDFVRKMMSVAVHSKQERTLITKGAVESVLEKCSFYLDDGTAKNLTIKAKKSAMDYYEKLSSDGYRVLALAIKKNLPEKNRYTIADEKDLILAGFVSFFDSAKDDADETLKSLQSYGVEIKVITGDNEFVTQKVCRDIGLNIKGMILGKEIASLTDDALGIRAEQTTIFARFSPDEKNRVITALRKRGHVVGYLGDGINDAPSLKTADVGISVDHAVDVAKEAADIILTKKHLGIIIAGVIEGRKSFGNTMKYILMGLSSNFGNMFSVLGAIFYLPFLPMLPIQILLNNFIYDFSQVTIPSDNVDDDWIRQPKKWNLPFMVFGRISEREEFLPKIAKKSYNHKRKSCCG